MLPSQFRFQLEACEVQERRQINIRVWADSP